MTSQDNITGSEGGKKKHLENKKTKHLGVGHILQSSQAIKKNLLDLIDRLEKHEEMLKIILQEKNMIPSQENLESDKIFIMSFLKSKSKKVDDMKKSYQSGGDDWIKILNKKLNHKITFQRLGVYLDEFLEIEKVLK